MRIPTGSVDRYIFFVAVDSTDLKTRETGLSSFTVRYSLNGGAPGSFTTPTINETDQANMPGVYELLLDEQTTLTAGHDTEELILHITHAGMAPVDRVVEIYRPKGTEGNTITVELDGMARADLREWLGSAPNALVSARVDASVGTVANDAITAAAIATGAIDADSIAADAITAAKIAANAITSSELADGAITAAKFGSGAIDATAFAQGAADKVWSTAARTLTSFGTLASDVWAVATRLLTAGTNIVLAKGTGVTGFNDITADAVRDAILSDSTPFAGADVGAIKAKTDNLPTDPADESLLEAAIAGVLADTDDIQSRLPATLSGGRMRAQVEGLDAGTVTAAAIATNAVDADALAADAVDKILDEPVEGSTTLRQMLRGFAAYMLSKASGGGTTTITFRDVGDTKDRVVLTVDADTGDRSAVVLDLT